VLAGLLTALSVPVPEAIVLGVTGLYVGAKAATSAVDSMARGREAVEARKGAAAVQVAVVKETGSPTPPAPSQAPPMPLPPDDDTVGR
jgi:hypothetical protein